MKIKVEKKTFCVTCGKEPDNLYALDFGNGSVPCVTLCRHCLALLQTRIRAKLGGENSGKRILYNSHSRGVRRG